MEQYNLGYGEHVREWWYAYPWFGAQSVRAPYTMNQSEVVSLKNVDCEASYAFIQLVPSLNNAA